MAKQNEAPRGEIVKAGQAGLTQIEAIPDYLKNIPREGMEEMDREDFVLPRIAIAQTLSPAINKKKPGFISGLLAGQMYNTVTREIYGEEIHFVAVLFSKSRIYFEDINKGGGIICQSANAINGGHLCPQGCDQCQHSRFVDGEAPDCNKFMNYPGFVIDQKSHDLKGMAAVSMKSTAITVAKNWNSLIRLANVPTYGKVYRVSVVEDSRDSNDFWNFKVEPIGFTPQKLIDQCKNLYESLKRQGVKVDLSDAADETDFSHGANTNQGF
jgi:hypothetical protein